jgi:hypothetical protein
VNVAAVAPLKQYQGWRDAPLHYEAVMRGTITVTSEQGAAK